MCRGGPLCPPIVVHTSDWSDIEVAIVCPHTVEWALPASPLPSSIHSTTSYSYSFSFSQSHYTTRFSSPSLFCRPNNSIPMEIVLFITRQHSLFDHEDDNENRSASASLTTSVSPGVYNPGVPPASPPCPGFREAWGYFFYTCFGTRSSPRGLRPSGRKRCDAAARL